ncbi:hypothetical protein CJ030_MR4G020946 [Morella rubra]|uniref:Uncharacterized protein n=1 Tax=Morella rubra TaxID=262757 RepID=A0A6A1VX81_9ROSI|nr:hypothetical protein CJ030_MR4G020946 [Morella rubra]
MWKLGESASASNQMIKGIRPSCQIHSFWMAIGLKTQVVLELQDNGNLTTSDDPPVVFGFLYEGFVQKVVSQHMARHSPLRFDDLLASIGSSIDQEDKPSEVEMVG